MPLDYSKFSGIGDSDSEGSQRGLDLSALFSKGGEAAPDSPPDSPRKESPRAALQRSLAAASNPETLPGATPGAESASASEPATFERFLELAEGAEQTRADDSQELVAVARATVQSAVADGQQDAPGQLMRSLAVGLAREPKPVAFAREQAPELVNEVLVVCGNRLVEEDESQKILELVGQKCEPRELYTFLAEALCGEELGAAARVACAGLLRTALMRMDESKRHLFLGSSFPALLRRAFSSYEALGEELEALLRVAVDFLPKEVSGGEEVGPEKVAQSLVLAFLFKLLLKALPAVIAVEGFEAPEAAGSEEPDSKRLCGAGSPHLRRRRLEERLVRLRSTTVTAAFKPLCAVARHAAAASGRPLLALLEEMEVGDPTSDGGGDMEVSPLCLASFVCLLELHGGWYELRPQVLPVGLSAARLVNVLMRACFVLVSNREVASDVVTVGEEAGGASSSRPSKPCWAHRGLALFVSGVAPLVRLAAVQTPTAYASASGPLCRWYPARSLRAVLEALASTPDIDREVRGTIFRVVSDVFRAFAWPCRFELYLAIITGCRVDSIIGAVVTLFKDDWWASVGSLSQEGHSLGEERARLSKVFRATLSGDLQIVDGMDTLTAALNIARLVALARPPAGPFLREGLKKGGPGVDLDSMLAGVSRQIDCELTLVDKADAGMPGELAHAMQEAMGSTEGGVNFKEMKRDRISMVAHLVARVRELLSSAEV